MIDPPRARASSGGRGFSLVEVIVALGLLAGVVLSVMGLIVVGQRHVKSGRNSSEALAVARDIVEEIDAWGFAQLDEKFTGSCAPGTPCDSRSEAAAADWQARLVATLGDPRAEIVLEPLDAVGTATGFDDAVAVRVTVTVFWEEGPRDRHIRLASTRL